LYQQQSFCEGQAGSAREAMSTTTMVEFVESGTTTLLSKLTLLMTSSSETSMELRICTSPGMPAGKTQTQKYVSNVLFCLFPCIKLCFHVWICSQVWLNLPSDNCPLFPHLPTDDGHFGYKQKQFAKKKLTCAIITIWLKNGYL
jgi:hypothetical protein